MAARRCFSTGIVRSRQFVEMSKTAQALYFQLIADADDDGIVDAYMVMRFCDAQVDDLRLLMAKGFVYILDEQMITYIEKWTDFNTLDRRYKRDSQYLPLLIQVRPDVEIIPAQRERRKRIRAHDYAQGLPMGNTGDTRVKKKASEDNPSKEKTKRSQPADSQSQSAGCSRIPAHVREHIMQEYGVRIGADEEKEA